MTDFENYHRGIIVHDSQLPISSTMADSSSMVNIKLPATGSITTRTLNSPNEFYDSAIELMPDDQLFFNVADSNHWDMTAGKIDTSYNYHQQTNQHHQPNSSTFGQFHPNHQQAYNSAIYSILNNHQQNNDNSNNQLDNIMAEQTFIDSSLSSSSASSSSSSSSSSSLIKSTIIVPETITATIQQPSHHNHQQAQQLNLSQTSMLLLLNPMEPDNKMGKLNNNNNNNGNSTGINTSHNQCQQIKTISTINNSNSATVLKDQVHQHFQQQQQQQQQQQHYQYHHQRKSRMTSVNCIKNLPPQPPLPPSLPPSGALSPLQQLMPTTINKMQQVGAVVSTSLSSSSLLLSSSSSFTTTTTTTKTTSPSPSPSSLTTLRSSRSFTAQHCPRPNVTLIRRKSASERLAESKSKYIRVPSCPDATDSSVPSNSLSSSSMVLIPNNDYYQKSMSGAGSTKSSYTSSNYDSFGWSNGSANDLEQHSNYNQTYGNAQCYNCSDNLVTKINNYLNKTKNSNNNNNNNNNSNASLVKKRISPRLSENSAAFGSSVLELQLRELITLDKDGDDLSSSEQQEHQNPVQQFSPIDDGSCVPLMIDNVEQNSIQKIETNFSPVDKDIYRAELKYICSSSSSESSSSIFSEPYNISSSPEKMPTDSKAIAPSFDEQSKPQMTEQNINGNNNTFVVRSKSNLSCPYEKNQYDNSHENIGQLLQSLCLDSNAQTNVDNQLSPVSNHQKYGSNFSSSMDSLEKMPNNNLNNQHHHHHHTNIYSKFLSTSNHTNDFSSLDSSTQLSIEKSIQRRRNHSGSTSKLTFENLMLHQQNLSSSRSCNNLIVNFHNSSSVVERNARIIKWLFNCRKAMDQSTII